ncbi:hypothetical protein ACFQS1_35515 [Paractinoplanes rhizophilus]|uniref:Adhesin n=1 Tax=Paractinoplanes rhizophilus TaxID=1416877 RepID=A0ABW2I341_9ACTN
MLTISNAASDTIHEMLRVPGVPPEGGVRLQCTPDHRQLSILLVPAPCAGDMRYDAGDGASLYVAAEVADRVRDKTFDARRNDAGCMQFVLDRAER